MYDALGVGIDLCAVPRMERAVTKRRFMERVFTAREREYLESRGAGLAQSAAAMFAAKEAVAKALGTGFSGGVMPGMIEVTHAQSGAPEIALSGAAAERLAALGGGRVLVSLTHEQGLAAAFAFLWRPVAASTSEETSQSSI